VSNPIDEYAHEFALHFPFGGLLLCLRVITMNPALVTSDNPGQDCTIGGDLTKLLADTDTLLYLISCQKSHQLQTKGRKESAHPPNCVKFCTLTPIIC
jgi:hypothetical protein